jgi:hypothetical protein
MREWFEKKAIPQSMLWTGPRGIGKRTLAHYLVQWIHCENCGWGAVSEDTQAQDLFGALDTQAAAGVKREFRVPCGECSACRRAIAQQALDFIEVLPESSTESGPATIKIDQLREIRESQGFGAHEGPLKVVLIAEADAMTTQASNALLKILEEPPRGWVFILTARDPSLVLPTLLSRCMRFRLMPMPVVEIAELLREQGTDHERAEFASRLSQGSLGRALKLAEDNAWEQREKVMRLLEKPATELSALVDWASSEVSQLQMLCDFLEAAAYDCMRLKLQSATSTLFPHARISLIAARNPHALWSALAERIAEVRGQLEAPLNKKLLVQSLLLPLLEIRER